MTVAGYDARIVNSEIAKCSEIHSPVGPTKVFTGLTFFILSESLRPTKKSKIELEALVKTHGGAVVQTQDAVPDTVCIADRRTVKVASIQKQGEKNLVRPLWLFDCIEQARRDRAMGLPELLVPLEMGRHVFAVAEGFESDLEGNADQFGDGFARDISTSELRELMGRMRKVERVGKEAVIEVVKSWGDEAASRSGWLFAGRKLFFDPFPDPNSQAHEDKDENERRNQKFASLTARFAGATIAETLDDKQITHIVAHADSDTRAIRERLLQQQKKKKIGKLPRIVSRRWIEESCKERTLLDEERFNA